MNLSVVTNHTSSTHHLKKMTSPEPGLTLAATKLCSGCDPDVPGSVERKDCKVCRGTGREPLSHSIVLREIEESKNAPTPESDGAGDGDLYLEY